jgi:antirestriction protein ArdC
VSAALWTIYAAQKYAPSSILLPYGNLVEAALQSTAINFNFSRRICAAFLCAEFSLDGELRHAGYIQSWIGLLKTDCRAFFTACSKAQAAADYLRGLALRDQQPSMAA